MDSLVDNVTGYVEARIELLKIEIKEEVAKGLAKALVAVVMIAVFTLFVLLISVAAAYKASESLGIAVVASFYLFVGLIVFLFRNPITELLEKQLEERMKKKKK
jgi:uncharacterized membrane protein YqjE